LPDFEGGFAKRGAAPIVWGARERARMPFEETTMPARPARKRAAAPAVIQDHHVKARTGVVFAVKKGDRIRLTDLEGQQGLDFWAFRKRGDKVVRPLEFLSCEHTKPSIERLFPTVGDAARTNFRRPIMTVLEDKSPGEHDMQYAACDPTRYKELGFRGKHASCQDNFHKAAKRIGLTLPFTPQPWNIFCNFFINPDGTFTVKAPASRAGDNLTMRAEMEAWVIISACPQDLNATCGGEPTDIRVEVLR
jgi:uncharacterized protein YcgI (DUF1989 family)